MKIYIAHSGDFDYETKLYSPLKTSRLAEEHEFFFPHESGNEGINTKEMLKEFDVLIAEVSKPSTGEGIEIGRAEVYGVRVICIYENGSKPSSALRFVTDAIIEYSDVEDMIEKIAKILL